MSDESQAAEYIFDLQAEIKRLEDLILAGSDAELGLRPGASGMMGAPCMTAELEAEADSIRERRKNG